MFNATLRNMAGATGNAQDGLDAAGVTPPAGADGIRGWLSGIYNRLGGTLTVALSSSSPLDVSDRSARLLGHVTVDNTISVGSDVTDRSARLLGHVTVDSAPTTAVTGTFWQATQPVSGAVSVTGTVPVTGTFWQVTQPVSGTVSVGNFPATQPVSLATNTPDVTDRAGRLLGHVTVDSAPTTAITAAALPLPAGAALDATLTGGTQKTKIVDSGGTNVAAVSAAGAVKVDGSGATQPVSGTVAVSGTVPVSLATNTPDVTDRAARLLGHVTVDSVPTTAVTGTFFQATQPVSLAANQSVNNAQVNGAAVVTSVTGVQDVMPRKRTGATGLSPNYSASHITTNTTATITATTAYIQNVLIVVSGAGTAWTVKIQNKEATPKILYPATTAVAGTTQPLNLTEPVLATSGIDIITAGTTAGTVDVFVTYWQ